MTIHENRLKKLETKLNDKNTDLVPGVINGLRNQAPARGVIRLLAELYDLTTDSLIRKSIEEFMNDMKEPSLREEVVAELRKDYKSETIRMLVSSCWQSGLDYSKYASDFALIFTLCDYETAIECFTVLEGCSAQIKRNTKDHLIIILKENIEIRATDKFPLMSELVAVLS